MSLLKKKIFRLVILIFCIGAIATAFYIYKKIFAPNISVSAGHEFIYIRTGATIADITDSLVKNQSLKNEKSFRWLADKMKYSAQVMPGKYKLRNDMSNRELIMLLRSGRQTPVKLVFNNIRTKYELAGRISQQIEADSTSIIRLLTDSTYAAKKGFTANNIASMFIPNTYEFYWNTSAQKFVDRMHFEYKQFWNNDRKSKARKIGLTSVQISILASIVEQETKKNDEKPKVAGVYLNRLNKNWKLEADPTLVFALGNFTIRRVLNEYKEIDSPYNTYRNAGLPPGPICIPEISSLTSVLNYSQHEYMYFCARDDLSGYHAFARTYDQHLVNARKYQKALNLLSIRK